MKLTANAPAVTFQNVGICKYFPFYEQHVFIRHFMVEGEFSLHTCICCFQSCHNIMLVHLMCEKTDIPS